MKRLYFGFQYKPTLYTAFMAPKFTLLITLLLSIWIPLSVAEAGFEHKGLILHGELTQGAMIIGHVEQAKTLSVFEREVYMDESGNFVFGIGRDAPEQIHMKVLWSSGESENIAIPVKQRQYDIQRIDGVDDKYVRELEPELLKRVQEEGAQVWRARQKLTKTREFPAGFQWPAKGPVTGVYGSQRIYNGVPKRPHFGLDIAGPIGTPVYAPAGGQVTLVHNDMYYSGGTLVIDHGLGISSTFIHLNKIHVSENQEVKAGQLIADMGASGRVTGPHLDWRVNWFDERLDPALLLTDSLAE